MTIYAVMIGAGIITICIQIVKWLAERKPEDMQYREIEPMDVEDSEPTNDIERSYPKLSLLDHRDYELIEVSMLELRFIVMKRADCIAIPFINL